MFLQSSFGQQYPIDRLLYIGRDAPCQVRTPDALASRVHAAIWPEGGRVYVRDEQSLNGTFVNGTPLPAGQTRCLQPGDQVQIGQTLFTLLAAPGRPAPAPCPADRDTELEPALPAAYAAAAPRAAARPSAAPSAYATDPATLIEPLPVLDAAAAVYPDAIPPPVFRAATPSAPTATNPLPPVGAPPAPAVPRPGRGLRPALAAAMGGLAILLLGACAGVGFLLTPAGQTWVRTILGY